MTSSTITSKDIYYFRETDYPEYEFYCCADNHPLIAFVTQYCPLCSEKEDHGIVKEDYQELLDEYEGVLEELLELKLKAKNIAPEILI